MRTLQRSDVEVVSSTQEALKQDWTFNGASTRELTHCYHDYPARMVPQVARQLLGMYGHSASLLFDPYCGTGTSLVEALLHGTNAIGTDLNPLARLIARAKTSLPVLSKIDIEIDRFSSFVSRPPSTKLAAEVSTIPRIEFWFKPSVIAKLSSLKHFIDSVGDDLVQLFFQVAFSETVRESSNTRNDEFKLYRYDAETLRKFSPDVYGIMFTKLCRNRKGLEEFRRQITRFKPQPRATILDFNSVDAIPQSALAPSTADIVITSPPYGDSRTTVAYGQYSRLSAAWLGLKEPEKIDRRLMGGLIHAEVNELPCDALNRAIHTIREHDTKRAREVFSYYSDLWNSISNVSRILRPGGHACYVVGNRKVRGIVLPTDKAIRSFFQAVGFTHVDTYRRAIPNKRMPLRNSPTNRRGVQDSTMTNESIVVMRKI
jgi:site-specific DNA-methyltransferase (cytosine-N4-specific)